MMQKNSRIIIPLFLFTGIIGYAYCEDINLDKIVVTASRTEEEMGSITRQVDVITSKEISDSGAKTAADVLGDISSVDIMDYGALGARKTVQMRGSTDSQVLVMMDGRPINNAHSGYVDLNTIALENIDRIEVMRGAASGLYGSDAMGGVVNIITKRPPKEGFKTTASTNFGTFRTYIEKLNQGGRLKGFGYLLSGDYLASEGYRNHSAYTAKNASLKLDYEFNSDNKLIFNTGFHKGNVEVPGSITSQSYSDYRQWIKNFFQLDWGYKVFDNLDFSFKGYENRDRLEFTDASVPLDKSTHMTKKRGWELQMNYTPLDFFRAVGGFSYTGNFDDSTKTAKHKYDVRAWFLQNQLEAFGKLKVDFGARIDDYPSFDNTEISPNISFLYQPDDKTGLRLFYGQSYRVPTFSDLYWSSSTSRGNPGLEPERGKSYEFGIKREIFKNLKFNLAYFRNDYRNLIKWNKVNGIDQPENINKARVQGVEFGNKIFLTDCLDLDISYTYQRPMDNILHKLLTYQPQYKLNTFLEFHNYRGLRVKLKWEFVNRSFDNPANTIYVKRYFLMGMDVSKKINKYATFFATIKNLTNTAYQVRKGYPMPGFSIDGGFKAEF